MKRRSNLRTTCRCADLGFRRCLLTTDFDSPLYFSEVLRDKVEVRQCRVRDGLLMLPGDFEEPPNVVHMFGGEREIPPEG